MDEQWGIKDPFLKRFQSIHVDANILETMPGRRRKKKDSFRRRGQPLRLRRSLLHVHDKPDEQQRVLDVQFQFLLQEETEKIKQYLETVSASTGVSAVVLRLTVTTVSRRGSTSVNGFS